MNYIGTFDCVRIGKVMTFLENRISTRPLIDQPIVNGSVLIDQPIVIRSTLFDQPIVNRLTLLIDACNDRSMLGQKDHFVQFLGL
jgi:hypothetical protein